MDGELASSWRSEALLSSPGGSRSIRTRNWGPPFLMEILTELWAGAEAETGPPPRGARSTACQEHADLHRRLDVVEKVRLSTLGLQTISPVHICRAFCPTQGVENTVEKLEAELAALLEAIDAPQWRPLLDNRGETMVDILQDPDQRPRS
ncbi:unnamed protein product [Menidia menidia]|uniref:(Atlantic silverside) hypothetical protein n=1 Tax=Menidia menidia TaxID=238744 RepID=A0A8S4BYM2_9TELE|nr:unnamed protein product [Menidia menidia]